MSKGRAVRVAGDERECRAQLAESARCLLQIGRNLHPALLEAVKRDHARLRAALKGVRRG